MSEEEQHVFLETFGEISDRIFLERLSPAWPAFDFSDSGYIYEDIGNYGQALENRKVCPYIFYVMVVNSDGTVSTCVGDWKHHQIVGDLNNNSIKEIWEGDVLKEMWDMHLTGKRECMEMCKECKVISHGCYDNIDAYAGDILKRLHNFI